jgi:putative long chain acyl-CoA synthase
MVWMRKGRLGAPYQAPFDVIHGNENYQLRRYFRADEGETTGEPVLLIPPLMVTSEIYDISPELSSVSFLTREGLDVWLADFGRPELTEGGMERTLDDHLLAVDNAIEEITTRTGKNVHLLGYSQGGMFAYQVAAYRKSRKIASIVTFGSPVDIHRSLPGVKDSLAGRFARVARKALEWPLQELNGLPGAFTSAGFKFLNPAGEVKQLVHVLGLLHDRAELERQEPKRRFLGGEGFVAWPGPALKNFIDEVIVANRMASGGFVVNGVTTTLHDITCPILYFVGLRDEVARPASVRGIRKAAVRSDVFSVDVPAGHFGLVVGTRAMKQTWPTVLDWVHWRAHGGSPPKSLSPQAEDVSDGVEEPDTSTSTTLYDVATDFMDGVWERAGAMSEEVGSVMDSLRWQIPRLARLETLHDQSQVSVGQVLSEQAKAIGDKTFFIWHGRAYSYREADRRVSRMAAGLYAGGVRRGQYVGILMDNHPNYLVSVGAISRLGAVSVLINTGARGTSLTHAIESGEVDVLLCDHEHVHHGKEAFGNGKIVLVGRPPEGMTAPKGVLLMHDLLASVLDHPVDLGEANPGRASDLAMLIFTSGTTGMPKAARITNRRWAVAALGAAAGCHLMPSDTAYCCLPLHHSTGMLVGVGGALVGGSRLVLASKFSVTTFWEDIRRDGVTVVFYVGELCRYLLRTEPGPSEARHPVRLFVGNGLRPHIWQRLLDRFGPLRVLEFYGSTEGNVALVNLTGEKVGSVGRQIMGASRLELVKYDTETEDFVRDEEGFLVQVEEDHPGVLIGQIMSEGVMSQFDGYTDEQSTRAKILKDVFEEGDAWFNTGDLLRCDGDGDFYFVDRLGDTYRWKGENVSTEEVARVLDGLDDILGSVVYGIALPGREGRAGMAAVELAEGQEFPAEQFYAHVTENLFPAARPRFMRVVETLQTTQSLKYQKASLREEGADPGRLSDALYFLDDVSRRYTVLDLDGYHRLLDERTSITTGV